MKRIAARARLVDDILMALAYTARADALNGSEFLDDKAEELGLSSVDIRDCCEQAKIEIEQLVRQRKVARHTRRRS